MSKIKKIFITCLTMITVAFIKIKDSFAMMNIPSMYDTQAPLYGPPQPTTSGIIFKIIAFACIPIILIVGVVIGNKINKKKKKKKKQNIVDTNQNAVKNNDNKNV